MTRPLPDSDAYFRKRRRLRKQRLRRIALSALVLTVVVAIVYVGAGGELPDPPQWLEILLRGRSSEDTGGAA